MTDSKFSPAAKAPSWRDGMKLLREVKGYAKGNADAALTKDEQDTWRAHERNLKRAIDLLEKKPEPPSPAVSAPPPYRGGELLREALEKLIEHPVDADERAFPNPEPAAMLWLRVSGRDLALARAALRTPAPAEESKPVAWRWRYKDSKGDWDYSVEYPKFASFNTDSMDCEPLFASPIPAREGLEAIANALRTLLQKYKPIAKQSWPTGGIRLTRTQRKITDARQLVALLEPAIASLSHGHAEGALTTADYSQSGKPHLPSVSEQGSK